MALSEQDPTQALREAQYADQLAQLALQLAQSDVDQWSSPYGPGRRGGYGRGGGLDLGSLVLGGILLGGGGGFGGGRGGFGGRSPGSWASAASSCGPQSQRSEPNTSPVRHSECTRTSTSSPSETSP